MRKFELYFKNYLIGNIEMNDNSFQYVPNKEVIEEINDDLLLVFLKEKIDYLHPFFESRIKNMDKFNMKELKYPNSSYELKEIIKQ